MAFLSGFSEQCPRGASPSARASAAESRSVVRTGHVFLSLSPARAHLGRCRLLAAAGGLLLMRMRTRGLRACFLLRWVCVQESLRRVVALRVALGAPAGLFSTAAPHPQPRRRGLALFRGDRLPQTPAGQCLAAFRSLPRTAGAL